MRRRELGCTKVTFDEIQASLSDEKLLECNDKCAIVVNFVQRNKPIKLNEICMDFRLTQKQVLCILHPLLKEGILHMENGIFEYWRIIY